MYKKINYAIKADTDSQGKTISLALEDEKGKTSYIDVAAEAWAQMLVNDNGVNKPDRIIIGPGIYKGSDPVVSIHATYDNGKSQVILMDSYCCEENFLDHIQKSMSVSIIMSVYFNLYDLETAKQMSNNLANRFGKTKKEDKTEFITQEYIKAINSLEEKGFLSKEASELFEALKNSIEKQGQKTDE